LLNAAEDMAVVEVAGPTEAVAGASMEVVAEAISPEVEATSREAGGE
jgi:hypothetical protein